MCMIFFCSIFLFPLYDIVVYSNDYYLISDIGNLCWHSFFVSLALIFQLYWYFQRKSFFYFLYCFSVFNFIHLSTLLFFLCLLWVHFALIFMTLLMWEFILLMRPLLFYKLNMLYIALVMLYLHSTYFDSMCIFLFSFISM